MQFAVGRDSDVFVNLIEATREYCTVFDQGSGGPVSEFQQTLNSVESGLEFGEKIPSENDRLDKSSDNTTIDCHVIVVNSKWNVDDTNGQDF